MERARKPAVAMPSPLSNTQAVGVQTTSQRILHRQVPAAWLARATRLRNAATNLQVCTVTLL